ncbi:putative immunity protein [Nocardia sp. XZ_19_369]|uniref:putative immunity protein n=1 Tax=Nocardia sp. XZ_19_369 TaxID=2769487 RepID=UPI00188E83F7|nr:Imm5 family immunity protein [Nocardia sp. XZ_19_369]
MTLNRVDHTALALWAAACAEHVLPLFERDRLQDRRPAAAIEAARAWVRGDLTMPEARRAAFAAHDAARETTGPAAFAARAAGHAAATAHVAGHAVHAANYAMQAVQADSSEGDDERAWQQAQVPERLFRVVFPDRGLSEHGR